MIVAYDLSSYIYHYLCHRLPMAWEPHKVHHSAEVMLGVTKDRVHPLNEQRRRFVPGWDRGGIR